MDRPFYVRAFGFLVSGHIGFGECLLERKELRDKKLNRTVSPLSHYLAQRMNGRVVCLYVCVFFC